MLTPQRLICTACGSSYGPSSFKVPERSIELKDKNADKLTQLPRSGSQGFYAGHSFIRAEGEIRITICPWCRSSVSNYRTPALDTVVCRDCGTRHSFSCDTYSVPERSIVLKDRYANDPIESEDKRKIMGSSVIVCQWCGHSSPGYHVLKCKKCGTNSFLHSFITVHSVAALSQRNKNRDIHNGQLQP
jgi:DNA-directed RNA polymerase subunit M/transcription elongation factor TFIIS